MLWVLDFPLLEFVPNENRWVSRHHPFTSPVDDDLEYLESEAGEVRAKAYDLVLNGTEIGGGSIRIHRSDVQVRIFKTPRLYRGRSPRQSSASSSRPSNTERRRTAASRWGWTAL